MQTLPILSKSEFEKLMIKVPILAVSYTHLDVYKRQDDVERTIIMVDGTKIPFDDVFDLNGDTISVNQIE